MNKVRLSIDGTNIIVDSGSTILAAALKNNIYIPNLCHHEDLIPSGNCRMCMVEIAGRPGQVISCKTPVEECMIVKTESDDITIIRQTALELIHVNHTQDCTLCMQNNNCELQKVTAYVGID